MTTCGSSWPILGGHVDLYIFVFLKILKIPGLSGLCCYGVCLELQTYKKLSDCFSCWGWIPGYTIQTRHIRWNFRWGIWPTTCSQRVSNYSIIAFSCTEFRKFIQDIELLELGAACIMHRCPILLSWNLTLFRKKGLEVEQANQSYVPFCVKITKHLDPKQEKCFFILKKKIFADQIIHSHYPVFSPILYFILPWMWTFSLDWFKNTQFVMTTG